ncbi:D-amino acid dehydrogenase [Hahella aquimaris]|uniref:D-amino acid dehydrogenase n=1 Tax=Hahella sp. HNIBRBA332 TaxID=3015983 RepID=UPI00273AD6E7|nr:D-amino acid dehydrogenase [Hahella sp. HNIBRBA332]WLQ12901.1 D-amino acid dehydrogenase [Hahella sp. HNIBRBA332]
MRVIILGSGVIGVSTAYHLAQQGHEVTVVDRQTGPALETSYGNAGEISPGCSAPWATPGIALKAIKWLCMKHRPLVVRPSLNPDLWRWTAQFLSNANSHRYHQNKSRMLRLAEYSRDVLKQLRADTGVSYDERSRGTIQLFRKQQQVDAALADTRILESFGVPYELLDRDGCIKYEPGLASVRNKISGGLRLPGDETGDCFKFTQALAALAVEKSVVFKQGVLIQGLEKKGDAITCVHTDQGPLQADAYIVALGSYTPLLLKPLGLRAPIIPVKGYSITLPVKNPDRAPESTLLDETYKVAVTRLGDRIRVGGTAELAGYDLRLHQTRKNTLEFVADDLFGTGYANGEAEFWTGLRPMTPDGTPIVGATPINKLYVASGHGTLGWTMAAGTGRVMADIVSGRQPEIDTEGLGIDRY